MEANNQPAPVVLINKATGDVYRHEGEQVFTNLTTKAKGEITPDIAQKHLMFPVRLNAMIDKNPALLVLIDKLNLSVTNET